MTIVSYAQNFEDVMLWRALGHVRNGFYVDVGAAWPVQDSVTLLFKEKGWHGINVEPNPELHRLLVQARPDDINLAAAIGHERSTLEMEILPETGLSTLSHEIAATYRKAGREVRSLTVDVITLADLWHEYVPPDQPVHFLKVDVEGFEAQVLAGADWKRHRPWILVIEATRPTSQIENYDSWEPAVLGADYSFAYADGINRFYVADEHASLLPTFVFPPNVFDGFVMASQIASEVRAAAADVVAIEERHRAKVATIESQRCGERAAWLQTEWDAAVVKLDQARVEASDLHRQVGGFDALLGERERALASTTSQLHAALAQANEAFRSTGPLRQESKELRDEIGRLMAIIGNLERHIGDMYSSTSWRFARPVRLASRILSRLRRIAGRAQQHPNEADQLGVARGADDQPLRLLESGHALAAVATDLPESAGDLLERIEQSIRAAHTGPVE